MHHPIRIFVYSFIIILALMIALVFLVFQSNIETDASTNPKLDQQLEKIEFSEQLSAIINKRTQFIQSILLGSVKAEQYAQLYDQLDQQYQNLRQKTQSLSTAREQEYLRNIDKLNRQITEHNQQISVLYINGSRREAINILLNRLLPKTELQLAQLATLLAAQRLDVQNQLQLSRENSDIKRQRFIIYAVVLVLISFVVAGLAVFYGQRLSNQLENMNDYLEDKVHERTESLLDAQKELMEDNSELARLASTDALTGLSNRTHMGDILAKEHSRYQRHKHCFGIIMLDVDHFKSINDSHGHDIGDHVLVQLAQQLESALRSSDHIGRWGGEEFLICCTMIESDDIKTIAENIRQIISNTQFEVIDKLTVSLGCAIIDPDESIEALIKRADVALYQAKNNGRNQTVVSGFE